MTEGRTAIDGVSGVPSRFIDPVTADLNRLSRTFEDVQKMRKTHAARLATHLFGGRQITDEERAIVACHPEVSVFADVEAVYSRELKKTLKRHVLWPWLEPLKGLAGARTGRIVAAIGDPRRWPGQRCSLCGTTFPAGWWQVGAPCPLVGRGGVSENARGLGAGDADDLHESDCVCGVSCPGLILPPRPGTGSRSLWHYFGLMPGADGKLVRRRKTVQASYSPQLRALILGEMGIADQIVRHRTDPYRRIYDEARARLGTRGTVIHAESGCERGLSGSEASRRGDENTDLMPESDASPGVLPPWRVHKTARIIAAKAYLADLLAKWKREAVLTF